MAGVEVDPSFEAFLADARRLALGLMGQNWILEVFVNVSARLSYSNVVATLALFFALTGTAVAGGKLLITGGNVKNHSLTGVDVKRGSLSLQTLSPAARAQLKGNRGLPGANGPRGDTGPTGAQGATGAQGSAGKGVTTAIETGPDVSDYQDLTPLASHDITTPGDFVIFTALTVHNTGANDEYLNCGFPGQRRHGARRRRRDDRRQHQQRHLRRRVQRRVTWHRRVHLHGQRCHELRRLRHHHARAQHRLEANARRQERPRFRAFFYEAVPGLEPVMPGRRCARHTDVQARGAPATLQGR